MKRFLIFRAKRCGMGFSRSHRGSSECSLINHMGDTDRMQQPGQAACDQEFPTRSQSCRGQTRTMYEEIPLAPALIHHPVPSWFAPCLIQQPSQACLGQMILFWPWQTNLSFCGSPGRAAVVELPLKRLSFGKKN